MSDEARTKAVDVAFGAAYTYWMKSGFTVTRPMLAHAITAYEAHMAKAGRVWVDEAELSELRADSERLDEVESAAGDRRGC